MLEEIRAQFIDSNTVLNSDNFLPFSSLIPNSQIIGNEILK